MFKSSKELKSKGKSLSMKKWTSRPGNDEVVNNAVEQNFVDSEEFREETSPSVTKFDSLQAINEYEQGRNEIYNWYLKIKNELGIDLRSLMYQEIVEEKLDEINELEDSSYKNGLLNAR